MSDDRQHRKIKTVLNPERQSLLPGLGCSVVLHGGAILTAVLFSALSTNCGARAPVIDVDRAMEVSVVARSELNVPDRAARAPVPRGAVNERPDTPTPVEESDLQPSGLAVIARCAMIDVGMLVNGSWVTAEHPWEGGSDHDVFIGRGVPGVLFWHFTDFAYHTSLDRMGMIDGEEIRRTTSAIFAAALAVADPKPEDLGRYLGSLEQERALRIAAAREVENVELAQSWCRWTKGARAWLRAECLPGVEHGEELPPPVARGDEVGGELREVDPYECE